MLQPLIAVLGAATLAGLARSSEPAPELGAEAPELKAVKWYNTPPLTMAALRGQAVLVEVFRTW